MNELKIIRINKVLRELNISLERAVDYLRDNGIVIESNPNTKITEEVYNILCSQFAGDKGNKEVPKITTEELKKQLKENRIESLKNNLPIKLEIDNNVKRSKKQNELISNIIDKNQNSYFLVYPSQEILLQNNESIWKIDKVNKEVYSFLKTINIGDILIFKSFFVGQNNGYYLTVSGIAIITSYASEKFSFHYKSLLNNRIDIKISDTDKISDSINIASKNFIKKILQNIDVNNLEILNKALKDFSKQTENINIQEEGLTNNFSSTLAGLIADVDNGEDYLDIKEDILAFARVMAAKSFQPPLAIALLGKWGSGKSFFMRKLKENIQYLSNNNPQKAFCQGVVHVHFNAWSYMDANLWAGIVTRIFEGLDEYINGLNLSQNKKKEIENELFQKLTISKDEHLELESQQNQVKKRLQELRTNKKNIKRELKDKINSIRNNSIKEIVQQVDKEFDVRNQITNTLNENSTFVDSAQKFEKIVPREYWDNPVAFYNEIKSGYSFIKSFFIRKKWQSNLCWLLVFIFLISIAPIITYLLNLLLSWKDFSFSNKQWVIITLYVTSFTRIIDTYLKLKKQIAPFWELKVRYEKKIDQAIYRFKQQEKALKYEIAHKKDEIAQLNDEINANLELQVNLKFKLENSLSTHALYTFIEKRANSDDYKKHLGIVSLIRKDFEILSGLLTDHQTELVSNEDSKEFKKLFNKPLERIILYIDDLDRCPEERVVEVLEAVNLLMAFPLFVVVVGVDPRWVKKALLVKYKNQFSDEEETQEAISPSNYLEKIFQVPFHLKDADDKSIKYMIEKLAGTKTNLINDESIKTETNQEGENNLQKVTADNDKITAGNNGITADSESLLINNINGIKHHQSVEITNVEKIKALEISEKEIETIKSLTEIIGNNPRTIKRFINIYRIIKTHQDFNSQNEESILALIFLLSFSIGKYSLQFPELLVYINKGSFNSFDKLDNFFDYAIKQNKIKDAENTFIITNKFELLFEIIKGNNSEVLDLDISLLEEQYNFIHRFTFKNI